jgi:cytochrome c oxidase subunit 2
MIGRVVVLDPAHYEQWLKTGSAAAVVSNETPEVAGARLFQEQRCNTCHMTNGLMAPVLAGVFGSQVALQSGETVTADENYLRESIMTPQAKVVKGYQPNMPTFQGQISEDMILQLIAYIKSLSKGEAGAQSAAAPVAISTGEAQAATPESQSAPPQQSPPATSDGPAAATESHPTSPEQAAPSTGETQ